MVQNENDSELASLLKTFAPEGAADVDEDAALNSVAALAESFQPKGYTLSSTTVVTKIPLLIKHTLREYQHIGLDWLVTMYEKKLNGILADEVRKYIKANDIKTFAQLLILIITNLLLIDGFGEDYPDNFSARSSRLRKGKLGTSSYCGSYFCYAQLGDGVQEMVPWF